MLSAELDELISQRYGERQEQNLEYRSEDSNTERGVRDKQTDDDTDQQAQKNEACTAAGVETTLFLDVFKDSAVDCVKMLPFLFLAFYLLEVVEQHASDRMTVMLGRSGGLGPLIGSLLGSVPQCGFSIMASDFFASGVISMGTLLAVYLSTSDEAIIILLTDPEHAKDILFLVLTKIIIGTLGGYIVLFVERRFFKRDYPQKDRFRCGSCETRFSGSAYSGMESYEGGLRISFHFYIPDRFYDGSVRKQRDREHLPERKCVPAAVRLRDRADPELCGIDHADAALYGRSPELRLRGGRPVFERRARPARPLQDEQEHEGKCYSACISCGHCRNCRIDPSGGRASVRKVYLHT